MKTYRSDNLTIVPGSELPFLHEWRIVAKGLPCGSALFVVPTEETPMKQSMRQLAIALRSRGRKVESRAVRHSAS